MTLGEERILTLTRARDRRARAAVACRWSAGSPSRTSFEDRMKSPLATVTERLARTPVRVRASTGSLRPGQHGEIKVLAAGSGASASHR